MTFAAIKKALPKAPGKTIVLDPSVFADDWGRKPIAPVCVGLRLMSESDKTIARRDSEAFALELHPKGGVNAHDAFNDALMRHLVAFSVCDPNDVSQPWSEMELAESEVRLAFTSRGARAVYEAVELYEIESSPLNPEATNEELAELAEAIQDGGIDTLGTAKQAMARRLLHYVLDELRQVSVP